MINPVTVIGATAALGYWAIKGQSSSARRVAAARVAVMLAVSGIQDRDGGIAALATAFRCSHRLPKEQLGHLSRRQYGALIERALRIEHRLMGEMPPAVSTAPGTWGHPRQSGPALADTALVGALTAGDILYHAAAVDPAVLAAADFSRVLGVESAFELAAHASSFSSSGAQHGLRGYTAEQLVMTRLVEQGHVVELAADSATPGYDLIVDGNPVQVKCGTSLSLLQEHFTKYPDIPVIADVGLARMAEEAGSPWTHMVTTIDGFDLEYVQSIVDRSLDAAHSLGEDVVPIYAIIVGGARAASKAWKGEIPIEELPTWLILDLTIRGGLATAGQIGGSFVGLLVIGPAGALVLGPVMGVSALFGTKQIHDLLDRAVRSDWHADIIQAAEKLRLALVKACDRQLELALGRQRSLRRQSENVPDALMIWLDRRMVDDVISICESLEGVEVASTLRGAMELMIQASALGMMDPGVLAARKQLAALIETKPSTLKSISNVGGKLGTLTQKKLWGR